MTITLNPIQHLFQNYLMNPASMNDIKLLIIDPEHFNAEKRLKIYFDAYRLRLAEILASDYPKLFLWMGEDDFNTLAFFYLEAYPSKHFSVRYFGQYLSAFLKKHLPYKNTPYLAEIAQFEWALGDTIDAPDAEIAPSTALHQIPAELWGELKIQFHPSLQVLNLEWDIATLIQTTENEEAPKAPLQLSKPITWIFWRKEQTSYFRSLSEPHALALRLFQQGYNFSEVCEGLCDIVNEEEVPQEILKFILQSLEDSCISLLE